MTVPMRPSLGRMMSEDEIEQHKRHALKMASEGRSMAEIQAYADSVGVPQKKKIDYSPGITPDFILGAARSALHGASFGFDDEAVGSLYGLVTGVGAQTGRDIYRSRLQAFHDQNPGIDLTAQIAGGIASGGGAVAGAKALAPKALGWLSSLPGVVKAVGSAGLGGAAYAAGDVEGGMGERMAAAPGGAAMGAVGGGLMLGAGAAVGSVLKPVARKLPVFKKLTATATDEADEVVLKDLVNDGVRIPDLLDKVKTNALRGQPTVLADVAGENTVGMMSAIQSIRGPGKKLIKEGLVDRQMGSGDRLMDWLSGQSKIGLGNVEKVRNGLIGARALQAETLYDDAYKMSAPMTDRLKALFRGEDFKKAWNEARLELRSKKGIEIPPLSKPFFPTGASFRTPGVAGPAEEIVPPELPIAGLDWTKRYLDRMVRTGFQGDGWQAGKAAGLRDQLREVLEEVDELVPAYGLARKTYKGESEVIEALDMGRKWRTERADAIAIQMAGFKSDAEREAAKLGFMEDIRDAIYGKTAKAPDPATTVLGGKEMTRRLQAVFGKDADEFLARVRTEARFAETLRGAAHGSRTTPLSEVIKNFMEQSSGGVMGALAANRPGLAVIQVGRAMGLRFKQTHQEEVAAELSKRYMYGMDDPAELIGYLHELMRRQPKRSIGPLVGAALGGQVAASE